MMTGILLGRRYRIIKPLNKGNFGVAYLAEDIHLPDSPLRVVKKLQPYSNNPQFVQIAKRLFNTEAEVLYKLGKHEQIPELFAHLEENQEFYLVQEYIEGYDLTKEINGMPMSEAKVVELLQDILEVLVFVHQQGIIHRDIKPSNLMRRQKDNKVVMIDFGAVKQVTSQMLNKTVAIGTIGYMPEEQSKGDPKLASDIYALGMVAIQALTGMLPTEFPRDSQTLEIIWKNRVSVSQNLVEILDKMLRYDWKLRYQNAREVLVALNPHQQTLISQAPNKLIRKLIIASICLIQVVIIGGFVGFFLWNQTQVQQPQYPATNQPWKW